MIDVYSQSKGPVGLIQNSKNISNFMEFTSYLESIRVSVFCFQRDKNTRRNILDTCASTIS